MNIDIDSRLEEKLREVVNLKKICKKCDGENESCDQCKIIKAHKPLREGLERELDVVSDETPTFLTGSYSRNTIIRPPKDVDFFVVLNKEKYPDITPSALLRLLQSKIKKVLPDKKTKRQTHSVYVKFSKELGIDVIPAFPKSGRYLIPDVDGDNESWLESNPKIHKEYISSANESSKPSSDSKAKLVPLIKLIKYWKREKCGYLRSFHVEILTAIIFSKAKIKHYQYALKYFFENAPSYFDQATLNDPANKQNLIDDYLTDQERERTKSMFRHELVIITEAIKLEEDGKLDEAWELWNNIFNDFSERPPQQEAMPYPKLFSGDKISIGAKLWGHSKGKKGYFEEYHPNSRKLPKDMYLRFYVKKSTVQEPYEVLWQVINTGGEAEEADDLRGEIIRDSKGKKKRKEHTKYTGRHYMYCYAIKNGYWVAKTSFSVDIL